MTEMPALKRLLRAYLTPDWPEDYGDPWRAVEDFARMERDMAPALRDEVAEVLSANPTEADLRRTIIDDFEAGYLPEADGWTYRSWLEAVVRRVDEILAT